MTPSSGRPGLGGCLALLLFFVVEAGAGIGVGALFFPAFSAITAAVVPAREADFGKVVAVMLCFAPALVVVMLIDRLCRKLTGFSVIDNVPYIP